MSRYYKKLWRDAGPGGSCGDLTPQDIQRRVDAALDGTAPRRARAKKRRLAAVAVAAAVALGGAALAITQNPDLLALFFKGDPAPIQDYVRDIPSSVTDGRFTLTLLSSVTDGRRILFLIQIDALTDEAVKTLFSDAFINMDTFHLRYDDQDIAIIRGLASHEVPTARTETSRTFSMQTDTAKLTCPLGFWLDVMSEEHCLSIPVDQDMDSFILATPKNATASDGLIYTVSDLLLTPITLRISVLYYTSSRDIPDLNLFLLKKDGSLLTQGQAISPFGGTHRSVENSPERAWWGDYTLDIPLDLDEIEAVIVEDRAFPLNNEASYLIDLDPALYLSYLPLGEFIEEGGYSVPVTALCERLGADWTQAPDGTVTAAYRGITLTLSPGDALPGFAAFLRDGELYVPYNTFDAWGISLSWTGAVGDRANLWLLIP